MSTLARQVLDESAKLLRDTHLVRLEHAARALAAEDLWWRPHEGVLSVGTILRHLEGNVRQWLISGLGGQPDNRERAAEFGASDGRAVEDLLGPLRATVEEAAALLEGLDEPALTRKYMLQGEGVSGTYAVVHVVEHFAWHTGEAVWIAKARGGPEHGVAFFDDARVNAARNG